MSITRLFLVFLAVFLLLAAVFSVFTASGSIPFEPVLAQFQTAALLYRWVMNFFLILPFAVTAATVLAFSGIGGTERADYKTSALERSKGTLIILVVLGVVNGAWFGMVESRVSARLQHLQYLSLSGQNVIAEVRTLLDRGRIIEAQERVYLHRSILGETEENEALQSEIDRRMSEGGAADERLAQEELLPWEQQQRLSEVHSMTLVDLIGQAEHFLQAEDFFSAHHFASLALARNPNRQDARRIQARALAAIEGERRQIVETPDREFFAAKHRAYTAFRQGATIPEVAVEAWYLFRELQDQAPRDPDVVTFAPQALEQARRISFFVEDAREYQIFAGHHDLFFVNEQSSESVQLVYAKRLVRTRQGDFLYGIELMEIDRNAGTLLLHQSARYGKVILDRLVMRGVFRHSEGPNGPQLILPVAIAGGAEKHQVPLISTVDEIVQYGGGQTTLERLTLAELFTVSDHTGPTRQYALAVLLGRLVRIAGFFALTLGAAAVSRRYRSMYLGRPPVLVLLLLPVVLWVLWLLIDIGRAVIAAAVQTLALSFSPSVAVITVVLAVLTVIPVSIAELSRREG